MNITDKMLYLGWLLSNDGSALAHIKMKGDKLCQTQKFILKIGKDLGPYYFQGMKIYFLSLIRSSLLYGTETMLNIQECELRTIERIEESFLRDYMKHEDSKIRNCSLQRKELVEPTQRSHFKMPTKS